MAVPDPLALSPAPLAVAGPASRPSRHARRLQAIGRFLVVILLTYLGLLAVTFFIGRVIPVDPVLAMVGDSAPPHVVARVREEMGLNRPLYEQFYIYLRKVLSGDFGTSV
ncbi:MAG: ABC transporter permease, partial [Polaromonas sp.]